MNTALNRIGPIMLVGAGKMGVALARGWLDAGLAASQLVIVHPRPGEDLLELARDYGLALSTEASGLSPNVLVVGVKPQVMDEVLESLAPVIAPHTLVVSIAAGIDLARLASKAGTQRVMRTMPNTPVQVRKGMIGVVSGPDVTAEDKVAMDTLLSASGQVIWLDDEAQLDALTAVSGSGPAYIFHMVEALAAAGKRQGLPDDIAEQLARGTVIGAAALMDAGTVSATVLRENVTSPKGATAAGLAVLMGSHGLIELMDRTVSETRKRTEELGRI
ncbi:pyrroline-5-carboxylate reductase [Devosia alba]|uniref:pyrroline-5-carboxylate reductase n=1 Tax=Devosia alba TaxID=3152360 RepID=UPI0032677167